MNASKNISGSTVRRMTTLPDFDKETCTNFFHVHLKANSRIENVEIPQMKNFDGPAEHSNIAAPSYREVLNIIKKMNPGSSACPFDQIIIIILKRCSFLRTALHRIIVYCWERNVPRIWKHGFTMLIFKKDSPHDPSNFRPITLQPVFRMVFTSIIRNRIYSFLTDNKYIETKIQNCFWKEVSGTIEHTKLLTHIMWSTRKQTVVNSKALCYLDHCVHLITIYLYIIFTLLFHLHLYHLYHTCT
jgi:hypothetical protein